MGGSIRITVATLRSSPHFVIATAFILVFFGWQFGIQSKALNRLDGIAYDTKLAVLPPLPASQTNIQIVDIDEQTLLEIQRMPWSRNRYAELTTALSDMGAILLVYDILFSEPQPNPAEPVLASLGEVDNELLAAFDYDAIFAQSMQNKEVVLGTLLHHQSTLKKGIASKGAIVEGPSGTVPSLNAKTNDQVTHYAGYAGVIEPLATQALGLGFMNSVEDDDGFVRRAALIAKVEDQYFPSLALEAFRTYSLVDELTPIWEQQDNQRFLAGILIGASLIPTDNHGRILIPFKGSAKTYPYTSAADILQGKVDPARFAEAVVFIGTSASGLADLRVTPVAVNMPGVEIHATLFEAMLTPEHLIYLPDWWQGAVALKLLLIAVFMVAIMPRLGPFTSTCFALATLSAIVLFNLYLWRVHYIDLPIFTALLLSVVLAVYFITVGFFAEARKRKHVKAIFDQYVPPAHIDRLLDPSNAVSLDGEKKQLSVMFSDIRSFTTISESMSAQDLKRWLNQFFSPITKVIFDNDGTIDKYVGDMVMAFWGAPLHDPQHANNSIHSAFKMLDVLDQLNREFAKLRLPIANIGIGINTGEMNVGDMGSDYRRSYTVIGDAVNLGSRLEGLTKFYGLTILVSEFTQAEASDFTFLLIDKVKVKGKLKPVTIYSPLPHLVPADVRRIDEVYSKAIDAFFARKFNHAYSLFESIIETFRYPVLVKLYIERSLHYIDNPPPDDWDGSYTHTSK